MADYSICLVLKDGEAVTTTIVALDDRDAIEQVWRLDCYSVAELWQDTRLVGVICTSGNFSGPSSALPPCC